MQVPSDSQGVEIRVRFGRALRDRRKQLGLTQDDLAARTGIHRTYIAETEAGKRNIALVNIEKLAVALELPISTLFSEYGAENK